MDFRLDPTAFRRVDDTRLGLTARDAESVGLRASWLVDVLRLDAPGLPLAGYQALLEGKLEAVELRSCCRGNHHAIHNDLVDAGDLAEVWLGLDR